VRRQKRRDLERHEQSRNPDFDTVSLGDGSMRSDKLRLHIAISMQTRLQTGLLTGVSGVYTGQLVCKPVCQPIVVTFTQGDWFAYRFCKPSLQDTVYIFGHAHLRH